MLLSINVTSKQLTITRKRWRGYCLFEREKSKKFWGIGKKKTEKRIAREKNKEIKQEEVENETERRKRKLREKK